MSCDDLSQQTYIQLRNVAKHYMVGERKHHTLSPTALVNEAYLKFHNAKNPVTDLEFKHVAARNMRQVLVNYALANRAEKRGGDQSTILVPEDALGIEDPKGVDLLELHEALEKLKRVDSTKATIVDMRYFGGFTNEEIASHLDISLATVKRKWTTARAWLYREISR